MGYDDNSPMTGVTGGSLPAEIWREVMVAAHEGLTPQPLPIVFPEAGPDLAELEEPTSIEDQIRAEIETIENDIEDAVTNILGRIFGSGN